MESVRLQDGSEFPATNIRHSDLVECDEGVPDGFDVNQIWGRDGKTYGETELDDGSYVQIFEDSEGLKARRIEDDETDVPASEALWTLSGYARTELVDLIEEGLSPAEAMDYVFVKEYEKTTSEWADTRGVSHQAVSANVRKAREKLDD